jgi:hypothetical protein
MNEIGVARLNKLLLKRPLPSACITHDRTTYRSRIVAEQAAYDRVNSVEEYNQTSVLKCGHCSEFYIVANSTV